MIEDDDPSGVHTLMSVKRSSVPRNRPFQSCSSFSRELEKASTVMSKNLFQIVSRLWSVPTNECFIRHIVIKCTRRVAVAVVRLSYRYR